MLLSLIVLNVDLTQVGRVHAKHVLEKEVLVLNLTHLFRNLLFFFQLFHNRVFQILGVENVNLIFVKEIAIEVFMQFSAVGLL